MNIQHPYQIQHAQSQKTHPLYKTNPQPYISFKGAEYDIVEISDKKQNKATNILTSIINRFKPKSNKEIFKDNLKELGFSDESVKTIVKSDQMRKINKFSKEYLKSLTKDIPDIKSEDLRAQYLLGRARASYDFNYSTNKYDLNKTAFDTFNNIYSSNKSLHNPESLDALTNVIHDNQLKSDLKFLNDNLNDDKNANLYLTVCEFGTPVQERFEDLKTLAQTDCDKDYLAERFVRGLYPFNPSSDEMISRVKEYNDKGISSRFLIPAMQNNLGDDDTKSLCDFVDEVAQNRNQLMIDGEPALDSELIELFIANNHGKNTLRTLDIFGEDSFKKMFSEGSDRLEDYIENIGNPNLDKKELQPLIELVNPTNSYKYIFLETDVYDLKQQLRGATNESYRQRLIQKINETSKEKNALVNNSIKDPVDKGNAAMVFVGLIDNRKEGTEKYKYAHEIAPYLNPKTDEEKAQTNNKLNDMVWKSYEIDCPEEIRDKFDFSKSKYLKKMFCPSEDFSDNFEDLVNVIKKYKRKNVANALDMLPQNVGLKDIFNEYGFNYKKWTRFDPDLKLDVVVNYDSDKMKQNAITNLESEFNDKFFTSLPDEQKDSMQKTLAAGGYQIQETSEADFVDDGYYNGKKKVTRLYKDGKPIEFKDLSNIFKLLDKEFSSNEYWDFEDYDGDIETSKGTFKDHIKTRHEEMKRIRQIEGSKSSTIRIQKADMNDIPHALFLGNDASCCTAIGSFNDWSAPNYIKNKMVQAIELKDGDNYVGNTMIYLAAIDEKLAIFLDNIELKPKYQYNDTIEKGIIDFAKMIGHDIGCANIDVYAGPNRHKLNMKNFELENKEFQLIGSTGDDEIYVDALSREISLNNLICEGTIYKLKD